MFEEITKKDKVEIDGVLRDLRDFKGYLEYRVDTYTWKPLKEDFEKVERVEKYYPKIYFDGSYAYLDSFVLDDAGRIVKIELSGQEQHLRSITSMIMLGKTSNANSALHCEEIYPLSVYENGYKRILHVLGDGMAHAIVYSHSSIMSQDLRVLTGKTHEDRYKSFLRFLKISMKYPTYMDLNEKLFERFIEKQLLKKAKCYNDEALIVSEELFNNDCEVFRKEVIELLKEHKIISDCSSDEVSYSYAKSKYLEHKQVVAIYDKLKELPNSYETDGINIKEKVVKIFGPSMTYYVVEANKGDDWYGPFERCFGYVKNEACPENSEWGYFSVPELLEVAIPLKISGINSNGLVVGYEMDLYFDSCINRKGEIIEKN